MESCAHLGINSGNKIPISYSQVPSVLKVIAKPLFCMVCEHIARKALIIEKWR